MRAFRKEARRPGRRAFRPALDGTLESRALLSGNVWVRDLGALVAHGRGTAARVNPNAGGFLGQQQAARFQQQAAPRVGHFKVLTFAGGQGVRIIDPQGEIFDAQILGTGTIRAQPLRNGTIKLIAFGTTPSSELIVDPTRPSPANNPGQTSGHRFYPGFGKGDEILSVGGIDIRSGRIGQISGFRTVDLSGPITIVDSYSNPNDAPRVDRIALNALRPGASIHVAGDLDTLDIFTSAELIGSGSGIFTGRDLNWTNVRGDLKLGNGGQIDVGRDLGLLAQPAKGTGVGGQGMLVQGDFLIDANSSVDVGRNLVGPLIVRGDFLGSGQVTVNGTVQSGVSVLGQSSAEPTDVMSTIPAPRRR